MTKDEAMKLAQDACPYFDKISKGAFYDGFITALDHFRGVRKLIEPDMGIDRGAWSDVPDATKWVDELRGDEQPEQEPVAWMYVNRDGECEQIEYGKAIDDPSVTLLYTAPPKREFVGLTDEEIDTVLGLGVFNAIRAVETKLKEKNS